MSVSSWRRVLSVVCAREAGQLIRLLTRASNASWRTRAQRWQDGRGETTGCAWSSMRASEVATPTESVPVHQGPCRSGIWSRRDTASAWPAACCGYQPHPHERVAEPSARAKLADRDGLRSQPFQLARVVSGGEDVRNQDPSFGLQDT